MRWSILDPVSPARTAALPFALALLLSGAVLAAACGGSGSASSETAEPAGTEPDDEPLDDGVNAERSGWRWKGKRGECFFRVGNHCYSKLEAACRAARCSESRCAHDDGVPAVVTCRR